jgi:cell division protein FtsW
VINKTVIYAYEKQFLFVITFLLIIGAIFIYSASAVLAIEMYGSCHYFVKKHLFGLMLGFCGFIVGRIVPINFVHSTSLYLWAASFCLTSLTLFSSHAILIHGSKRWLSYGGLVFQPSELLKIAFIIYISTFFSENKKNLNRASSLPLIIVCGLTSIVLLMQPDFGLTVTLLATTLILFFITCSSLKHILATGALLSIATATLILTKTYRLQRILTFLDPWKDPKGKGFQIIQSFIAIGSGGWTGTGVTHSKQKFFYLPMQHTDFIFSIIAEETGFIGSILLITIFAALTYTGLKLSTIMQHRFNAFCVLTFTILIGLQTSINLAVASGLVPTKGIGLPFVSYGNTNTVCTLAMVGFLINLIRSDQKTAY